MLSRALSEPQGAPQSGSTRDATLRQLARKVEEVHTTLRKHLAKEDEQLLPLLLHHFSYLEQAELVAQFLCCIPLAAVAPVLSWLKRSIPPGEQTSLLEQVRAAVPDKLLQQLMVAWLAPSGPPDGENCSEPPTPDASSEFVCCRCTAGGGATATSSGGATADGEATAGRGAGAGGARCADVEDAAAGHTAPGKPPLREIMYFHQAIRSALSSFAGEARTLRGSEGGVSPAQLTALLERHRFIRAVCLFHSSSEDEIVFPALRRVATRDHRLLQQMPEDAPAPAGAAAGGPADQRHRCEDDHAHETAQFEELGRLLGDVKACVRRGAKEVAALTENLSTVADRLARAMSRHMAREESDVLPVLMRSLCAAEQRHMVWRILCAMPLRLLERVMPWVAGKLREDDVQEWLDNIRKAAPPTEAPLVELLSQWAARGTRKSGKGGSAARRSASDDPTAYSNETCGPGPKLGGVAAEPSTAVMDAAMGAPAPKRIKTGGGDSVGAAVLASADSGFGRAPSAVAAAFGSSGVVAPIDHIFQFHKALRRELKDLETCAIELQAAADATPAWAPGDALEAAIQGLQGRFQFLRGIYQAHSSAEDEIVFPALEAKEMLSNVSHAYTLDHRQEESLFEDVAEVISGIGACVSTRDLHQLRALASRLARMCAAVRASLETHVRAEEKELWPLFAEHFTVEEQQHLVGMIIGRTGAEVLHVMLSWVKGAMTDEESEGMMSSLKSASKATAFEQWLGAALEGDPKSPRADKDGRGTGAGDGAGQSPWQDEQRSVLAEVAGYLAKHGIAGGNVVGPGAGDVDAPSDPGSLAAQAVDFRPGWEDIFRMNQKQLEVAVRRVSADASLEPQRKAYLIQHLMASRYIVAQQRRMASTGGTPAATPTAAAGTTTTTTTDRPGLIDANGSAVAAAAAAPASRPKPKPGHDAPAPAEAAHPHPHQHRHYHDPNAGVLGCRHYHRSAALVAPCCGEEFVCRLCHDEAVPDHKLDRFAVRDMRCMVCGVRQGVGAACTACGASMARYYCSICHLFDDDPHRDIYHCPFCNFCRRVSRCCGGTPSAPHLCLFICASERLT